jgi:hypothetical protein
MEDEVPRARLLTIHMAVDKEKQTSKLSRASSKSWSSAALPSLPFLFKLATAAVLAAVAAE